MKRNGIPKASDYFKPEEMRPCAQTDYTDKVLILNPAVLLPRYRERKYLLWRAKGGFGCSPTAHGTAVFAICIGDNEGARWNRANFVAEFVGQL